MIAWSFAEVAIGVALQEVVLLDGFRETAPTIGISETRLEITLQPLEMAVAFVPSSEHYTFVEGLLDENGNWLLDENGNILSA